jgi:hypothetical protein
MQLTSYIYSRLLSLLQWDIKSTPIFKFVTAAFGGHAVASLRHYATSWKVAGLNPDEVIGFFN